MSQTDYQIRTGWRIGWMLSAGLLVVATAARAQQQPVIGEGEVTTGDVYVRSGASLNHYTICKLNAGDRVKIVGERKDWYEILPPDDAFSLISGEYVDTADNKVGVVNGDNVRVRAGSVLNDNKYTVQRLLAKGESVTILERDPNGFLRIVPPPGATLWISRNFVELASEERAQLERTTASSKIADTGSKESSGEPLAPVDVDTPATPDVAMAVATHEPESPLDTLPPTDQRRELAQIDIAAQAQIAKPLFERQFDAVLKRYGAVAEQEEDVFAKRYAEHRVEQIGRMIELSDSVRKVRELGELADARRRDYLSERMLVPEMSPPVASGLDARGELRVSALYPVGRIPQRYRLVDDTNGVDRTVGYVEIPRGSTIDAKDYLGRYVGVRASKTRLQADGVNPIPIYEASELVVIQRRDADATPSAVE